MSPGNFAERTIAWQQRHGRHDLPWQVSDPYRIWLSEIMLQQTQVGTVIPYFERFLRRFPDLHALAEAELDTVLGLWSGLGYYARARNLHRCARLVVLDYGGRFPATAETLATLPGIGPSTAAAIAVFSASEKVAILDGNVKRVLCRHYAIDGPPSAAATENVLWQLARSLLPETGIKTYTQGLMDLGATLCKRTRPRCGECPHRDHCQALATNRVGELPTKKTRKPLPLRHGPVLIVRAANRVLLETRPAEGLWGGLASLPALGERESAAEAAKRLGLGQTVAPWRALPPLRHTFTHFRLDLEPWRGRLRTLPERLPDGCFWQDLGALTDAPLPKPIRTLLRQEAENHSRQQIVDAAQAAR
jgi:A/G-specific adenine glycosylase